MDGIIKEVKYMTMEDIIDFIESMSLSQGFYGRLLLSILELKDNDEEEYNKLVDCWENRFKDPLDFVFYIEC